MPNEPPYNRSRPPQYLLPPALCTLVDHEEDRRILTELLAVTLRLTPRYLRLLWGPLFTREQLLQDYRFVRLPTGCSVRPFYLVRRREDRQIGAFLRYEKYFFGWRAINLNDPFAFFARSDNAHNQAAARFPDA